jgi:hypothetical protein
MTTATVPQNRAEFLLTEIDFLRIEIREAVVQLNQARREETAFRFGELAEAQQEYDLVHTAATEAAWADYAGAKQIISGSNEAQRRAQLDAYLLNNAEVKGAEARLDQAQAVMAELHDATQMAQDALQGLYAQAELVRSAAALKVAMLTYDNVSTLEVVLDDPLADDLDETDNEPAGE